MHADGQSGPQFFCVDLFIPRIHDVWVNTDIETKLRTTLERVALSLESIADSLEKVVALLTVRTAKGRKS